MLLSRISGITRVKPKLPALPTNRTYIVLGIETSCDDTSVCLYDRRKGSLRPELLASLKIRADNSVDGGIVPTKALSHHQANLGILVQHLLSWRYPLDRDTHTKVLKQIPALSTRGRINTSPRKSDPLVESARVIPDLICVTRGPGMRGSLAAGTEFAKGLAVALNIPIIGVHHMLGHLLSARMVYSRRKSHGVGIANFPYVTMLVSGGHTMLVLSRSLTDHEILADTVDIAIGDAIEKCARFIGLEMRQQNSYGPSLEVKAREYRAYLDGQYEKQPKSPAGKFNASEQPETPAEKFDASEQPESNASGQPETHAEESDTSEQPETPAEKLDASEQPETPVENFNASEQPETPAEDFNASEQPETPAEKFDASEQPETHAEDFNASEQPETPAEDFNASEQPETPPEELKSLSLNVAMRNKGTRTGSCAFSFAGYLPMVERSVQEVFGGNLDGISELQRAKIAYEIQQAMFTQIIERVKYVLDTKLDDEMKAKVKDIVLAGGVASNQELRHMFRTQLQTYSPYPNTDATKPDDTETGPGIPKYNIFSPPPALCTDNSEMIAWAGIELWESQKLRSELSMEPLPEWPLENFTTNVDGWTTEPWKRGAKPKQEKEELRGRFLKMERDPRRPYSKREPRKPYSEGYPRRPYSERDPWKPYAEGYSQRPYSKREPRKPYLGSKPRKPYSEREPRKPYSGSKPWKPYSEREPRKPYSGSKPWKPYSEREPRKPYLGSKPWKPYSEREPRKPFEPREEEGAWESTSTAEEMRNTSKAARAAAKAKTGFEAAEEYDTPMWVV